MADFPNKPPTCVNLAIKKALKHLRLKENAIIQAPIQPSKNSLCGNCFENVRKFVAKHKEYEPVLGWDITTNTDGTVCEAEYHAIVKHRNSGEFIDITPSAVQSKTIWFVPDNLKYTFERIISMIYSGNWKCVPTQMYIHKTCDPNTKDYLKSITRSIVFV